MKRSLVRLFISAAVAVLGILVTRDASAYPWMIRHDYGGCAQCHTDPSGSGLLTAYGRAQGDLLMRMRYGAPESDEPGNSAGFLWGAVTPPDWLIAGGGVRTLALATKADGAKISTDFLVMQADLHAEARVGGFRANASIGGVTTSQSAASIAGGLVSREHWIGYAWGDDAFLVRAGRINLPFGLRQIDHTLYVRQATRTDINDTQEDGVALAYTGESVRAEVMAIAGNYQVSPDAFRERGYSAHVEVTPWTRVALGASSLAMHANEDVYLRAGAWHQAHGLFARVSPWRPLVLLAEVDAVLDWPSGGRNMNGAAGELQADVEPIQGLHVIVTGEAYDPGAGAKASTGIWLGVDWFFLPHCDVRADVMAREMAFGSSVIPVQAYMAQLHVYL